MRKKLWAALTVVASLTLFSGCAIKDSLMHSPIGFLFGSQHKWEDGKWDSDENGHWTACSEEICTERKNYGAHTYDNACDDDCNVCGAKRTPAHKYKVVSYKADCENDARTVEVCMLCNQEGDVISTQVGSAIGHDWKMDYIVIDPDRNFCEDGGRMADVCQNCKKVEIHKSGSRNHVSTNWTVDVEPTETTEGTLIGKCETCGKEDATLKLPVLSEENYAYTEQLTNDICTERAGTLTYRIYVGADSTLSVKPSEGVQEIILVVTAVPSDHLLNGVAMNKTEYLATTKGITEFKGQQADCKDDIKGQGYYTCDVCEKEYIVTTYKEHNNKVEVITQNTCTTPGENKETCLDCGNVENVTTDPLGHSIKNTLQKIGEDEFQVIPTCQRADCEFDPIPFDGTVANGKVKYEVTKQPTCNTTGIGTYSAIYNGKTIYGDVVLDCTAHRLKNGQEMNRESYPLDSLDFPGIKQFDNKKATCTQTGVGYYECYDCGGSFSIVIQELEHPYKVITETPATCTQAGYILKKCEVCGQEASEEPEATGHKFTFKNLVTPTYDEMGSVVVYCECEDILPFTVDLPTLDSDAYTKKVLSTATCEKTGLTEYKLDVLKFLDPDGEYSYELTFKADIEVAEHYPLSSITYTWEETIYEGGRYVTYVYTGRTCETCKRLIVMTKVKK